MHTEAEYLQKRTPRGVLAGFTCYILWGAFPLYWKLLDDISSWEVICQRIIWCAVFSIIICLVGRWDFIALLKNRRALRFLIPAAALITVNWSVYIFAVHIDRIVETSIGYYINPLVSILLGLVISIGAPHTAPMDSGSALQHRHPLLHNGIRTLPMDSHRISH